MNYTGFGTEKLIGLMGSSNNTPIDLKHLSMLTILKQLKLNETNVNRYLNIELNGSDLLKESKKPNLNFYQISKDVNKPTNNSLSLIQKVK